MPSWLTEIFHSPALTGENAILATLLFAIMLVTSLAIALAVVIRLPPDYCRNPRAKGVRNASHGIFRGIGAVLKNVFGVILVLIGAILSLPGLPGPGLIIVLAGVFLLDFPGKRQLLWRILSRPRLLRPVNRLRRKFSQPPFLIG